jgi:hypothetical protein
MLETGLSSKSSWRNSFPLLIGYNFFSFTSFDRIINYGSPSTTSYYKSSTSTGFDAWIDSNCSSTIGLTHPQTP